MVLILCSQNTEGSELLEERLVDFCKRVLVT